MPDFFDLQVDTETMGLPPDGALLSIGACFFDIPSRAIGPTFHRTINLATSVRDGGKITPSTCIWWLGQSEAARNTVRFGGADIRQVLQEFSDFILETCRHEDVRPWGNSASFDMSIVGGAYARAGLKQPWYWSNERDFRTVRNLHPHVEYNPDDKGEGAHNALEDALFQTRHLFKIADRRSGRS